MEKTKKYLIITMPVGKTKNIGDYIQVLAVRQFYDRIDGYIEKEELSHFHEESGGGGVKAIISGWFMWKPENWPPSDDIDPLFISIHFSPLIIKDILSHKEYLEKHSPVGCRDFGTMKALREEGINSYFSGCLTLTLGNTYHFEGNREGVYFVDPFFPIPLRNELSRLGIKNIIRILLCFATNFNKINHLSRKRFFKYFASSLGYESYESNLKGLSKSMFKATCFYMTYRTKFSDKVLLSAEYIMHIIPVNKENPQSHDDWLNFADEYLKRYMKAKLVVTSRIHAALPSIALETPVIFMNSKVLNSQKFEFNTPGRLEGIVDFFRTMTVNDFEITTCDDTLKEFEVIDNNTIFRNKDNWRKYADSLSERCRKFLC